MNNLKLPFFRWRPTTRLVSISTFAAHVAVVINIKWYNSLCNKREMRFYLATEWRRKILLRVFSTKTNIGRRMANTTVSACLRGESFGEFGQTFAIGPEWGQLIRDVRAHKTKLHFKVFDFIVHLHPHIAFYDVHMNISIFVTTGLAFYVFLFTGNTEGGWVCYVQIKLL